MMLQLAQFINISRKKKWHAINGVQIGEACNNLYVDLYNTIDL